MKKSERFETLDGIRGVAAIAVMLGHMPKPNGLLFSIDGSFAVDLFFCLSGFVIAHSYWNRLQQGMLFSDFITKRLIRLYPMYFMGACIGAAVLIFKTTTHQSLLTFSESISAIILNTVYLPYLSESIIYKMSTRTPSIFPINDPAWSLFFEFVVNALFALWAIRAGRKNPIFLAFVGVVGLIVYVAITKNPFPGWGSANFLGGFPRTLSGFFLGILVYSFTKKYKHIIPTINPIFFLVAVFAIALIPQPKIYGNILWLAINICVVPVLVASGCVSTTKSPLLLRLINYLGWISYPLYCLHYPIILAFYFYLDKNFEGLLPVFFCISTTFVIAHFATKYIEEPVRERLAIIHSRYVEKRSLLLSLPH